MDKLKSKFLEHYLLEHDSERNINPNNFPFENILEFSLKERAVRKIIEAYVNGNEEVIGRGVLSEKEEKVISEEEAKIILDICSIICNTAKTMYESLESKIVYIEKKEVDEDENIVLVGTNGEMEDSKSTYYIDESLIVRGKKYVGFQNLVGIPFRVKGIYTQEEFLKILFYQGGGYHEEVIPSFNDSLESPFKDGFNQQQATFMRILLPEEKELIDTIVKDFPNVMLRAHKIKSDENNTSLEMSILERIRIEMAKKESEKKGMNDDIPGGME